MPFYLVIRLSVAIRGLDWPVGRGLAAVFCGVSACETVVELAFAPLAAATLADWWKGRSR